MLVDTSYPLPPSTFELRHPATLPDRTELGPAANRHANKTVLELRPTIDVALTFRSARWGTERRPEDRRFKESAEQSENVYENKGSAQKSTTPDPSLSKEGNYPAPCLA
jgi:hypothetical protein